MLTLQEMIGWQALTGLITSPAGGIPANILPPAFLNVTRQVNGDTGSFKIVSGNRELARLVHMGDPSVEADTGVIGERAFKCLHTFEHLRHKAAVLANLTSYENEQRQRLAADEIDRKTGEFRQRLNNLRLAATYSALLNGAIWFDKNGRMLISNSGAVTTIDYAVDAACKGNITGTSNVLLAGSTAKWSTAGYEDRRSSRCAARLLRRAERVRDRLRVLRQERAGLHCRQHPSRQAARQQRAEDGTADVWCYSGRFPRRQKVDAGESLLVLQRRRRSPAYRKRRRGRLVARALA
jgi:hypothetical protein